MKSKLIGKYLLVLLACFLYVFLLASYQPELEAFVFKETFHALLGKPVEHILIVPNRLKEMLISFFAGVAICVSGAVFQSVFKNPLASPNTIGSTAGVTLGNMAFVLIYGTSAAYFEEKRYLFCYATSALIVAIVCLLSRLFGKGNFSLSIESILIVGILVSNFTDIFIAYCRYLLMTDDTGLIYKFMQYSNGDIIYLDKLGVTCFYVVIAVSLLGSVVLSRKIDILTFDDVEAYSMGVRVGLTRLLAIVIACLMSTAAIVHCGSIGFISMFIPYLFRLYSGKGFYEVGFRSAIVGGVFVVTSRAIYTQMLHFGIGLPASALTSIFIIPLFFLLLVKSPKGNDDNHSLISLV